MCFPQLVEDRDFIMAVLVERFQRRPSQIGVFFLSLYLFFKSYWWQDVQESVFSLYLSNFSYSYWWQDVQGRVFPFKSQFFVIVLVATCAMACFLLFKSQLFLFFIVLVANCVRARSGALWLLGWSLIGVLLP